MYIKIRYILTMLVIISILVSCGGGGSGGSSSIGGITPIVASGTIKGQLYYTESSGAPAKSIKRASKKKVEAVKVQVENTVLSTYTDTDGNFEIKNVPPGNHSLIAEQSDDLKMRVGNITVTENAGKDIGKKELHETAKIIGKAQLSDQSKHDGITVFIPGTKYSAQTNPSGHFMITGVPVTIDKNGNTVQDPYEVIASKADYEPYKVGNVTVLPDRANHIDTELVLSPTLLTGSLTGKIVLSDGSDYSGVTVSIKDSSYSATTNSGGVYTISNIPVGPYTIEASKTNYKSVRIGNVPVDPNKTNNVPTLYLNKDLGEDNDGDGIPDSIDTDDDNDGFTDIEETAAGTDPKSPYSYPTGTIEGYVGPSSSSAIVYAQLNGIMQGLDIIDGNGYYKIEDLPSCSYTMTVKATGYDEVETSGITVQLGQTTTVNEITLSPTIKTGSISGKVILYNQSNHSGIIITVQGTSSQATTSSSGEFELTGVNEGFYTVVITKEGYLEKVIYNVLVLGDETIYLNNVILIPVTGTGGTLTGTITLEGGANHGGILVMLQGTSKVAVTDSSGSYTIKDIPAGDTIYTVSVSKLNYNETSAQVTFQSTQITTLNLILSQITIADMDGDGIADHIDPDKDGDGVLNGDDAFASDSTEWSDLDGDSTGDNSDTDIDGDGYANSSDAFPRDRTEWLDTDSDGTGNNRDTDDDGDGYTDVEETQYGSDSLDSNSTPVNILSITTGVTVINNNYLFEVYVYAKGVTNLKVVYVNIAYDAEKLTFISDTQGAFLGSNNGSVAYLSEQSSGLIEINTSVLGGSPKAVSGSGIIATLKFAATTITDLTNIQISSKRLMDINYDDISVTSVDLPIKIK